MRAVWALSAEQDRADIVDFIALDNPLAAVTVDESFVAAARSLGDHPLMGRPGQIAGTSELTPHESYHMVCGSLVASITVPAVLPFPPRHRTGCRDTGRFSSCGRWGGFGADRNGTNSCVGPYA
jgi:toxin ParE1/3/4